MSYYNTTNVKGAQRSNYIATAKQQEAYVENFFRLRNPRDFTPSEVHQNMVRHTGTSVPITSVRRAITNCTNKGLLVKTSKQRTGPFNRPEYCWRYNTAQTQQDLSDLL